MGYTHYWRQRRNFTAAEWAAIVAGFKAMRRPAGVRIADGHGKGQPKITDLVIEFNGVDQGVWLAHEGMGLSLYASQPSDFCKTERKPYDILVTGLLLLASHVAPSAIQIDSDGDMDGLDWRPARELLALVWPAAERELERVQGEVEEALRDAA